MKTEAMSDQQFHDHRLGELSDEQAEIMDRANELQAQCKAICERIVERTSEGQKLMLEDCKAVAAFVNDFTAFADEAV
jgi:predicted transcriptional regulator